jgi:hypothetical protein
VVVAHVADYVVVFPSGADRAHHLHASGHGYWPLAVVAAALAGIATLAWAGVRGVRAQARPGRPSVGILRAIAVVGAWQAMAFTAVEVLERVVSGAPVVPFATSPELAMGLALQVVVAAAVVVLLALVEAGAARLAAALGRRTWPLCRDAPGPSPTLAVLVAPAGSPGRPRGPPVSPRR